jgi:membrane-anchored mycosin MYCP
MVRRRLAAWTVAAVVGAVGAGVPGLATPAWAEPVRSLQWHLATLKIDEVHKLSTGAGVVVAVLDTGVQSTHPDLAGRVLDGVHVSDAGTADDDKGLVDGTNHGTAVAGLIAAKGGGPDHALGIAPDARILPVTVHLGDFGPTDAPAGIRWAVDHGAKVINLSIGGQHTNDEYDAAVRYALDHDVVVVAAAGNVKNGDAGVQVPGRLPGVLAVTAVDRTGTFWSGSAHGPQVGLAAPGVDIESLANHFSDGKPGGYIHASGTSGAAPMVAGAAALVRSRYPALKAPDVVNRLIRTADDAGPAGRDDEYGFGRLDILRALTADVPHVDANPLGAPAHPTSAAAAPRSRSASLTRAVLVGLGGLGVLILLVVAGVLYAVTRSGRRRTAGTPAPRPPGWDG